MAWCCWERGEALRSDTQQVLQTHSCLENGWLQGLDTLREHHSFTDQGGGEGQPKRQAVDLSQLSLQDTNEEEVSECTQACTLLFASARRVASVSITLS